ncbi:MAG: hypothetical protein ACOYBY_13355 [Dermatophilaceae bacterium]
MSVEVWWARLRPETREWLVANNGDVLPQAIVEEITRAGGNVEAGPACDEQDGAAGACLSDATVDWIEAVANGEEPSAT